MGWQVMTSASDKSVPWPNNNGKDLLNQSLLMGEGTHDHGWSPIGTPLAVKRRQDAPMSAGDVIRGSA